MQRHFLRKNKIYCNMITTGFSTFAIYKDILRSDKLDIFKNVQKKKLRVNLFRKSDGNFLSIKTQFRTTYIFILRGCSKKEWVFFFLFFYGLMLNKFIYIIVFYDFYRSFMIFIGFYDFCFLK